ncbi:MAG: SusD/RagB family nutrient-binding outer membrane lipoprotein [Bacteroidales bacterium]|nr:SusD/RagB family nutrient-binding outer membrane lipoprotein [Bacteroidales bacterium]
MKKLIILIFVTAVIFSVSCKKFLDVNHDPNNLEPEYVSVDLVFPAAVENSASIIGSYGLMVGEIWSQHWTSDANAPQYQSEDSYQVTAGDYNYDIGLWSSLYAGALKDYEFIREKCLVDSNWTYYLMATTMQCYTFQLLADFFDQIPVTEALKGVDNPIYNSGQEVYDILNERLNFALAQNLDAATCLVPGKDDLVFQGEMGNWIAFANTLKLKMFLRQVYVSGNHAVDSISALVNSGVDFITIDATFTDFVDESGRDNYMYAMEFRGGNMNMRASKTLLDFLVEKGDNRYEYIFKPANSAGDYNGMYQGDYRNEYSYVGDDSPDLSSPRIISSMPMYFMSASESYFLQAEAALRIGSGMDSMYYTLGILADINRLESTFMPTDANLDNIDVDTILNFYAQYDISASFESKLEKIIVQKWVALANIGGFETFFEHNRTGYPRESSLSPSESNFATDYVKGSWIVSLTGVLSPPVRYPKRLIYTSNEQSKNINTPAVEPLNSPIWWDQKEYPYVYE